MLSARSSRFWCLYRTVGAVTVALCSVASAQAQQLLLEDVQDDAWEVPLLFKYEGVVETYLSARYRHGDVYVPLGELFRLLKVDHKLDLQRQRISGFFLRESQTYAIDLEAGQATLGAASFRVEPEAGFVDGLDLFVRPALIEDVFDVHLKVDLGQLKLWLVSELVMPVLRLAQRAEQRARMLRQGPDALEAPVLVPAKRRPLSGGILDYDVTVERSEAGTFMNLSGSAGAQVMGGGLRWDVQRAGQATGLLSRSRLAWHYVRRKQGLVSQFKAGSLYSNGLHPVRFQGVTVTNEPFQPRTYFGTYLVEGTTRPDWEVELYLNEQLVDFTHADETGRYAFEVPLRYGSSSIQIKCFGPAGEVQTEERRLQLPFTFLPPGQVRYTVQAGRQEPTGGALVQAHTALGLSRTLTLKLGMDGTAGSLGQALLPYASLSARLGTPFMASATLSPRAQTRVSLRGLFPGHSSFEVAYHRHVPSLFQPFARRRRVLRVQGRLPLSTGTRTGYLRLSGSREQQRTFRRYRFNSGISTTLRGGRVRLRMTGTVMEYASGWSLPRLQLEPSLVVQPRLVLGGGSWLRDLSVITEMSYDVRLRNPERLRVRLSRSLFNRGRIELTWSTRFRPASAQVGLRLVIDQALARMTSTVQRDDTRHSAVHRVTGSMGLDETGDFFFYNRRLVGRSGATLRLFVDADQNGRFDPGETVVKQPRIRVAEGRTMQPDPESIRIVDLRPGVAQTAHIDPTSILNPLWVPQHSTFVFYTEPNTIINLDVPLFVAGAVEGLVVKKTDTAVEPVAGVRLLVRRLEGGVERTLHTFSDGMYLDYTLPPGTYEIAVDASQLELLGLEAVPSVRQFTIDSSRGGEYVDHLDFTLRAP